MQRCTRFCSFSIISIWISCVLCIIVTKCWVRESQLASTHARTRTHCRAVRRDPLYDLLIKVINNFDYYCVLFIFWWKNEKKNTQIAPNKKYINQRAKKKFNKFNLFPVLVNSVFYNRAKNKKFQYFSGVFSPLRFLFRIFSIKIS